MPKRLASLCMALALICAVSAPVFAQSANELAAQAAAAYDQRADLAQARQAVQFYEQALAADPASEETAWRLARALYWVGNHSSGEAQLQALEKAVESAQKAIALNPKSLPGHYWLGVCYGVYGKAKGIMKSLSLVDPIKQEMALVMEMDPAYEDGGPHRVLGRLYHHLPGLVGGSKSKAAEHLEKAVALGPQRWLNHLYLAQLYLDQDKKDQARELLQKIMAGPAQPGLEPEYADWRAEAMKLLEGLK